MRTEKATGVRLLMMTVMTVTDPLQADKLCLAGPKGPRFECPRWQQLYDPQQRVETELNGNQTTLECGQSLVCLAKNVRIRYSTRCGLVNLGQGSVAGNQLSVCRRTLRQSGTEQRSA